MNSPESRRYNAGHSPWSDLTTIILLVAAMLMIGAHQGASRLASRVRYDETTGTAKGMLWHEAPQTALGAFLVERVDADWRSWAARMRSGQRSSPLAEAVSQNATDRIVIWMNRWMISWPVFLVLSALGLLAFLMVAMGELAWPSALSFLLLPAYVCVVNAGLAATMPDLGFSMVRKACLCYASVQAVSGLLVVIGYLATILPYKNRKLKYGPPFQLPMNAVGHVARSDEGILAGKVEKKVLPAHTAWNAGASGDVVIPFDRISCSVTILGEKGSGKSRLLFRFHDAIRKRYPNVPMLIHDPKGEWFRTFYDPDHDLVFAPHFKGSTHWSIWNDFARAPELCHELISTAVYAHDAKADTFWMDSAIRLLRSVAHEPTIRHARARLNNLRSKNSVDKTWLSIYQVAQLGLEDIVKVELPPPPSADGKPLVSMSIDDYLDHPGRIFLLNDPSCATEQKGAFSLFLSAFMLRALSREDLPAGQLRAVAIVDEALTFNLPPDVDRRIYAMCRSKGLSVIAGAQRLPGKHPHERGEWATAEFLFGMKVISQDTQSSLARRAGQVHFDQVRRGRSWTGGRVSISESDQAERFDAIPPEHFARLAPRKFVLFHDRGLVAGFTAPIEHEQRKIPMPEYDRRQDVMDFGQPLGEGTDSGPKKGEKKS
jgi:hypothetical protein